MAVHETWRARKSSKFLFGTITPTIGNGSGRNGTNWRMPAEGV